METNQLHRRTFIQASASAGLAGPMIFTASASEEGVPAALGGSPVRSQPWESWPKIMEGDEEMWLDVLRQKGWCRLNGDVATEFEKAYAEHMGVKECIAVANGTSALFASINALGIGAGDEVLVPSYTFVATVNVPLLNFALPVFVDTDRNTFQMDPNKIEERITEHTKAIMPVHLGGNVADMDAILEIAKKHNLPVIEDACQSHWAEWRGKKVGSLGDTGCFSFQVTKNLSAGEGGAVISDNEELMDRVYSFHTNGRERTDRYGYGYIHNGTNIRMTEFQAALLLRGLDRLGEQAERRARNADYLTRQLREIEGIHPAEMYEGTTLNAYHLYMLRYDPAAFAGLSRDRFINALRREGITSGSGYSPLNKEPFLKETLYSRGFENVYSKERLDAYFAENNCPENDRLCGEAVWFFQFMFLGDESDMDQIATAIRKIQRHAQALADA